MRAFVTGSTGFIGRNLVERLLRDGNSCVCLSRTPTSCLQNHPNLKLVQGDIGNTASLLATHMADCDIVFHLAGLITFDPTKRSELVRINGDGTERILEASRIARVPRVVIVSSACTIGLSRSHTDILDETAPFDIRLAERNPYLFSKHIAESHALSAAERGQNVVVVNPTTVYGAGDNSLNSGTLIRQVAQSRFIPIPPGGSNVVSVDDVVQGILQAGERGKSGQRYILGGFNLKFAEIISDICTVVGRRPWYVPLLSAAQLPMMGAAWLVHCLTRSNIITPQIIADTFAYKFYSSNRAECELGWRACKSFEETVADAWRYYLGEGLIDDKRGAAA